MYTRDPSQHPLLYVPSTPAACQTSHFLSLLGRVNRGQQVCSVLNESISCTRSIYRCPDEALQVRHVCKPTIAVIHHALCHVSSITLITNSGGSMGPSLTSTFMFKNSMANQTYIFDSIFKIQTSRKTMCICRHQYLNILQERRWTYRHVTEWNICPHQL